MDAAMGAADQGESKMKDYFIYYRGQNINQLQARSEADALKRHFKQFSKGSYKTVAKAIDSLPAEFEKAIADSQQAA